MVAAVPVPPSPTSYPTTLLLECVAVGFGAVLDEHGSIALTLLLSSVRLERIHSNVALLKEQPLPILTFQTGFWICELVAVASTVT